MRRLLSKPFIPFGSQYYRAPSPKSEDWEKDLREFASVGFNMVKFWVQWRWNQPDEDRFYFEDIDRLMDLAAEFGLRVMLNTIVDVAPHWIYQKFPEAVMVTLDGRRVGPQTQPHRQIGGLGLCFNHAPAMEHLFNFIRETVRRYREHPALEMWNVASEPELTSSMSELRLYADDAEKMGDMLCYCECCQEAFRAWLSEKYGSIEELNHVWKRNYRSFADAEVPRTRNTFDDLVDWRMFFVDVLGRHVKRRFEVAAAEDGGRHPLLCHHVFIQGFPVVSTANDPWNVAKYGDLHGITQMDDPMMVDVARCAARGRPVLSAEMLMLPGYTLHVPKPIDANDIKRFVFTGLAGNLKGFLFWQYRPEVLGREAPAWGLTYLDGSPTPRLHAFAEVNRVIQKNADFLLDARAASAEVALLYSPRNQIFAWATTGSEKTATDSLLGAHAALYRHNYVLDLIHPDEVTPDFLRSYKVIVLPFPYYLERHVCSALAAWVEEGGVLVAECYCAGWDAENGEHMRTIPGYELHKVFKVRQKDVIPCEGPGVAEMEMLTDLPYLHAGGKAYGMLVRETVSLEGAEALARFSDGEPAITMAKHGKGQAILIGSYVALPFYRGAFPTNGQLIASLVGYAASILRPEVRDGHPIRVDVLAAHGREMVIMRNLSDQPTVSTIRLPCVFKKAMAEQFSGETVDLEPDEQGCSASVALGPREVKVFCTE